ncbi:hypothetical protein J7J13_02010 [bacterium]|nr:hypothetical protein [bacterium]
MENGFEKFSPGQSEQKEKEQDKKEAKRRRDDILDKIQHYIDFLNETETAKKLMLKYGFEYSVAENIVEKNLISLAEDVNSLVVDKEMYLAEDNSLADIVGNSTMMDLKLVMRRIKNTKQTVRKGLVEGKIGKKEYEARNEENLNKLKKFLDRLRGSLGKMSYYVKAICDDREKLKIELSSKYGYLEKFSDYFFAEKYPAGAGKIAYFRFFNEWEQGNIIQEDLEEELEKLDGNFIDKDKIREDFKEEHFSLGGKSGSSI